MKVPMAAQIPVSFVLFFTLLLSPIHLLSVNATKRDLTGHVYDRDGTTALEGVVVKAKNIVSGMLYESSKSGGDGAYLIENMEGGAYLVGVESPDGVYNTHGLIGLRIQEDTVAEMSFSLRPYEQKVASAIHDVYQEQKLKGEALVGRVLDYNPKTGIAKIAVTKGLLMMNDRIHTQGRKTDFYQDLLLLRKEGNPVKIVLAGQDADILLKQKTSPDDGIYVVSKRRVLPLFLGPDGVATIVSRNSSVMQDVVTVLDEPIAASPFKK